MLSAIYEAWREKYRLHMRNGDDFLMFNSMRTTEKNDIRSPSPLLCFLTKFFAIAKESSNSTIYKQMIINLPQNLFPLWSVWSPNIIFSFSRKIRKIIFIILKSFSKIFLLISSIIKSINYIHIFPVNSIKFLLYVCHDNFRFYIPRSMIFLRTV